ncbi:hypothetical protein CSUI_011502, partial [Cystoisospora suis]
MPRTDSRESGRDWVLSLLQILTRPWVSAEACVHSLDIGVATVKIQAMADQGHGLKFPGPITCRAAVCFEAARPLEVRELFLPR